MESQKPTPSLDSSRRNVLDLGRAIVAAAALLATIAMAAPTTTTAKGVKNIVLVHGAFADGSSWSKVIPILQAKGYNVRRCRTP